MTKPTLIRWLTLTSFCLLITAFLLYRSGKLDKYFFKKREAIATQKDSVLLQKDSVLPTLLPSSKSLILVDKVTVDSFWIDTAELRMSSSKSGIIFVPTPSVPDSVQKALIEKRDQRDK